MTKQSVPASKEVYLLVKTRSILACFLHWLLFFSVLTLILTGWYIGEPRLYYGQGEAWQSFAMVDIRYYHGLASWGLMVAFFWRVYLSFTPSCNSDIKQFLPTFFNIKGAILLAKYFVTLRGDHAHYRFINPLGGVGIFTMGMLFFLQMVTGTLLYLQGADPASWGWLMGMAQWLEDQLGGSQQVRLIHHLALYLVMFVVFIHIYMQVWKAAMFYESDMSSIISGYKVFPKSEFGHFSDHYGLHLEETLPADRVETTYRKKSV